MSNDDENRDGKLIRFLVIALIVLALSTAGLNIIGERGVLRALIGVPGVPVSDGHMIYDNP